jgi:hypothetical protein
MTHTGKALFIALETAFVASALMSFTSLDHRVLQGLVAGVFLVPGMALFAWSFVLYRLRRAYAEITWITLFLVVVVSLIFPKL